MIVRVKQVKFRFEKKINRMILVKVQIQKEKRRSKEMEVDQDKHKAKFEKLMEAQKNNYAKVANSDVNEKDAEKEINIQHGKENQNGAEKPQENKKDETHKQMDKNKENDIEESNMKDKQNKIVGLDRNQNHKINNSTHREIQSLHRKLR